MRLPEPFRRRLRGSATRLRGFHGHVDGVFDGALTGWVHVIGAAQTVQVGLYADGALLTQAPANIFRGDVQAMGFGDGNVGFVLRLSPDIIGMIAANGGAAEVRVIGPRPHRVGRWAPDPGSCPTAVGTPPARSSLQRRLYGDLQRLARRLAESGPDQDPDPRQAPRPAPAAQARLFGSQDYLDPDRPLPTPMFAYAEFIRLRDQLDARFDPRRDPAEIAHFFEHYLRVYSARRGGLRIPLSAAAIDWLNAPQVIGGQTNSLSRATWAFLTERPPALRDMMLADPDWHAAAVYWWAMHQARTLYCEDCLVPQAYVDLLAAEQGPIGQDWPLSVFMMRLAAEMPELSVLPTGTEAGRRDLTCALMILALSRPDILRYMPTASLDKALRRTAETGQTPLARFCTEMGQPQEDLTRQSYAAALRPAGFDLERMRFMTLTAEGHRAEFARFAELRDGGAAELRGDIQVIGPFRKASGLGQATRLSADLLERAGYTVHRVDFALDNPSPEDAARVAATDIRPARINLFHLNAETVPLAAAYLPDAFSSAYNIAYVFWELDSPGACHPLGLDLVDEIWVAPEWGVEVFQPHTDKPVVNVGMSFETLPEIDRTDARRFMEHTAQVPPESFVFLVTFDSFSFMMRKNPLGVIEAFTRAFKDEPEVRLVLKTQNRTRVADPAQAGIWQAVDAAVQQDARIVLINETLPYEDILRLKTGADAYLSLHRSEGWGFGMIEAMNLRVPVVATAYSGNMDFCTPDTCWLVDYSLTEVGPQAYIFVRPGQKWADPDVADAARQMRQLFDHPKERATRAEAARALVRTQFSEAAIAERYAARVRTILSGPAARVAQGHGQS